MFSLCDSYSVKCSLSPNASDHQGTDSDTQTVRNVCSFISGHSSFPHVIQKVTEPWEGSVTIRRILIVYLGLQLPREVRTATLSFYLQLTLLEIKSTIAQALKPCLDDLCTLSSSSLFSCISTVRFYVFFYSHITFFLISSYFLFLPLCDWMCWFYIMVTNCLCRGIFMG